MDTLEYYLNYLSATFTGYPLVVKIAIILISIMALLYLISWMSILRNYIIDKRNTKRIRSNQNLVNRVISILFDSDTYTQEELKKTLKIAENIKDWKKIHLTDVIIEKLDLEGINQENLTAVLHVFRIPEFWENQMESSDMSMRWKAMRTLDSLSPYVMASVISKHAALEGVALSNYAKSVFSKFESHDAFKFLEEDFGSNLRELDKIRIHDALKTRPPQEIMPHVLRIALTTPNDDYRIFLIHEIKFLDSTENIEVLLELYTKSTKPEVKAAIVNTLSTLKYKKATKVFMRDYPFNKPMVQDEIIDAMGRMGGPDELEFLEKIYHQTYNKETLIRILNNIYAIDSDSSVFNRLKLENHNKFNELIFAFVEKNKQFKVSI